MNDRQLDHYGVELSFVQYYLLDVLTIVVGFFSVSLFIVYLLLSSIVMRVVRITINSEKKLV